MTSKSPSIAAAVIAFNQNLQYYGALPAGFRVLNPFRDNPETMLVMEQFYTKYYADNKQRRFIIGINPSRHGAGVTGVPFTDTKLLSAVCGIQMTSVHTHEVSAVFMYDMIARYGGAECFFGDFYINSPFPLAIVKEAKSGALLNANYYDDKELFECVKDFMVETLRAHIALGLDKDEVFVLGKKNAQFISRLNQEVQLFGRLTILEHPRFIQQYKLREQSSYIDKYILAFSQAKT